MGSVVARPLIDNLDAGYIYVLRAFDRFKIGKSKYLTTRLDTHYASTPVELTLIAHAQVLHHGAVEKQLHAMFKDKQTKPEWFRLTPEDVERVRTVLAERASEYAAYMARNPVEITLPPPPEVLQALAAYNESVLAPWTKQVRELESRNAELEKENERLVEELEFLKCDLDAEQRVRRRAARELEG